MKTISGSDRSTKTKRMKNLNKILTVVAFSAMFAISASAQNSVGYRPTGDDGITASPKVRELLNQRKPVASTPSAAVTNPGFRATGDDGITASPKLRQTLNERRTVPSTPSTGVASAGYRPTGDDGITASPKVRQQIEERKPHATMVAPLK